MYQSGFMNRSHFYKEFTKRMGVKGISFVELNKKDIVRHKLVERIVDAYEKFDKEAKF